MGNTSRFSSNIISFKQRLTHSALHCQKGGYDADAARNSVLNLAIAESERCATIAPLKVKLRLILIDRSCDCDDLENNLEQQGHLRGYTDIADRVTDL